MAFVAPDILGELCGLSLGLILAMAPIGLLLWLLGWWSHRFWIVLGTTVVGGVVGLIEAGEWKAQPIVVGVLLAIAAGVLALALVRILTFVAGGFLGLYLAGLFAPSLNQPAICFLLSGLACLLLFRWYFMALTSTAGTSILAYGTLALLHHRELLDAGAWLDANRTLLNVLCTAMAIFGFAFQFFFDRWRIRKRKERDEAGGDDLFSAVIGKIAGKTPKIAA